MNWIVIAIAFMATLANPAFGQDVSGGYFGATLGNLTYTERADGLVTQSDFDDSASTFRLNGGYRLGKRLALELGYAETDGISDTVDMDLGSLVPVDVSSDFSVTTARAIAHFPIAAERLPFVSLSIFVGAGLYDADLKSEGSVAGLASVATESSENGSTAVLGVQVDFPKVSVRGEYEWFDTESSVDLWTAGVGLIFRF
jgi:hypothetical protein